MFTTKILFDICREHAGPRVLIICCCCAGCVEKISYETHRLESYMSGLRLKIIGPMSVLYVLRSAYI